LVFRVGVDFVDAGGRAVRSGELLNLLRVAPSEEGFDLTFPDRNICLGDPAIIENADNAWFQPMPTEECPDELMGSIELELDEAEDEERVDVDKLEIIREDVESVRNGSPPKTGPARLRDTATAVW
jgi:hypothetical protein